MELEVQRVKKIPEENRNAALLRSRMNGTDFHSSSLDSQFLSCPQISYMYSVQYAVQTGTTSSVAGKARC